MQAKKDQEKQLFLLAVSSSWRAAVVSLPPVQALSQTEPTSKPTLTESWVTGEEADRNPVDYQMTASVQQSMIFGSR